MPGLSLPTVGMNGFAPLLLTGWAATSLPPLTPEADRGDEPPQLLSSAAAQSAAPTSLGALSCARGVRPVLEACLISRPSRRQHLTCGCAEQVAVLRLPPAKRPRCLARADHSRGDSCDHRVRRYLGGDHRAGPDDRVVADHDATQQARAVADPDVVADFHIALVDALKPDRPLHLHHAVVEVDHHHPVGDDALAADRDPLIGGDRALLSQHRLRADHDLSLVRPDLAAVADPRPSTQRDRRPAPDLEFDAGADEAQPVRVQPSAPAKLQPHPACHQHEVAGLQHPVPACETQERQRPAAKRRRRPSQHLPHRGGGLQRRRCHAAIVVTGGPWAAAGKTVDMIARPWRTRTTQAWPSASWPATSALWPARSRSSRTTTRKAGNSYARC